MKRNFQFTSSSKPFLCPSSNDLDDETYLYNVFSPSSGTERNTDRGIPNCPLSMDFCSHRGGIVHDTFAFFIIAPSFLEARLLQFRVPTLKPVTC